MWIERYIIGGNLSSFLKRLCDLFFCRCMSVLLWSTCWIVGLMHGLYWIIWWIIWWIMISRFLWTHSGYMMLWLIYMLHLWWFLSIFLRAWLVGCLASYILMKWLWKYFIGWHGRPIFCCCVLFQHSLQYLLVETIIAS